MTLLQIAVAIIVTGVALWVVNVAIPMAAPFKQILNVVVTIVLCLWLFNASGLARSSGFWNQRVGCST